MIDVNAMAEGRHHCSISCGGDALINGITAKQMPLFVVRVCAPRRTFGSGTGGIGGEGYDVGGGGVSERGPVPVFLPPFFDFL